MLEEELKKIITKAKKKYITSKQIDQERAKEYFKSDLLTGIISLVKINKKKLSLRSSTLIELSKECDNIISNINKRMNRNFFTKLVQRILVAFNLAKEDQTRADILSETRQIHSKIQSISDLKAGAERIIDEMKQYYLLHHLVDIKKLDQLNDKNLYTLFKLVSTDLSLNGLPIDHEYNPSKLIDLINKNIRVERSKQIEIIQNIVSDRNEFTGSPLLQDTILRIKASKSIMQVLSFERDSEKFKKDPEIKKLHAKMCDIRNNYFVEELAHSIASEKTIAQSALSRASKYLSRKSKEPKFIEEQILESLKPHAHLLFKKLKDADAISEFKEKAISMIQRGVLTGYAEAYLGIDGSSKTSAVLTEVKRARAGSFQLS